jgi:hypothetical protein
MDLIGCATRRENQRAFHSQFRRRHADPDTAVQQSINRTKSFRYGMVFLAHSY